MLSNWHIADPIAARSIPIESNELKLACVASPEANATTLLFDPAL